jgi:leucyl-tRNA synthetase
VEEHAGAFSWRGQPVVRRFGRMGKSLKNAVTPDEMYAAYGADTLRVYEMCTGPLDQSRPWETRAVVGSHRLLQRIWRVVVDEETGAVRVGDGPPGPTTQRLLHGTIAAVREHFQGLRFNLAIARITELTNHLTQTGAEGPVPRAVVEPLVLMLAPLAPHIAEELWLRLGHARSLAWEPFPAADPALMVEDRREIPVQINGKVRAIVSMPVDADRAAMEHAARANAKVAAQLAARTVRKIVIVPGRLVSFVVDELNMGPLR